MAQAKKATENKEVEVKDVAEVQATETSEKNTASEKVQAKKATENKEVEVIAEVDIALNGEVLKKGEKYTLSGKDFKRVEHLVKKA